VGSEQKGDGRRSWWNFANEGLILIFITFRSIKSMKMNFKEVANRITGISCPFFGVSWNPPESERKIAKRVITYLEDRRVLYSPYDLEVPMHCVDSIIEIRRYLTNEIGSITKDSEIEKSLRALRAACRKFLDKVGNNADTRYLRHPFDNISSWIFITGLGELRGVYGIHIATMAVSYGIDIEKDLASIIPESDEEITK
jgi:hypothetical protein